VKAYRELLKLQNIAIEKYAANGDVAASENVVTFAKKMDYSMQIYRKDERTAAGISPAKSRPTAYSAAAAGHPFLSGMKRRMRMSEMGVYK
jgi:hypothetical protein